MTEPFTLTIAKFEGSLGRGGINAGPNGIHMLDVRELQRRMKAIEPRIRTEFMRDIKAVGLPLESDVKSAIGTIEPLSGMLKDKGRLGWGNKYAPDKTTIQFRTSMGGRSLTTTLLRVKIWSPAVIISDMAGRSGRYIGAGRRNDNSPPSTRRRNANINKGNAFIRSLNEANGGKASRKIWPAAERSLPAVSAIVDRKLRDAMRAYNMRGF